MLHQESGQLLLHILDRGMLPKKGMESHQAGHRLLPPFVAHNKKGGTLAIQRSWIGTLEQVQITDRSLTPEIPQIIDGEIIRGALVDSSHQDVLQTFGETKHRITKGILERQEMVAIGYVIAS